MKLQDAATDWLDFLRFVRRVGGSSVATYEGHLRRFRQYAGDLELEAATAKVEPYLVLMGRRGAADSYFCVAFSVLRAFFRWASDRQLCVSSPLRYSKLPKVRHVRRSWCNAQQVEQLLRAAAQRGGEHMERDAAMVATIFFAALRNSEATGAKPEDLDLEARLLRVNGKGGQIFVIPLPERAVEILRAWLRVRPPDAEYLFPARARHGSRCGRLDSSRVGKILREIRELAGLEKVTAHTLRRSRANILRREKGAPLEVVRDLLRHAQLTTTQAYLQERGLDGLRAWVE